MRKKLKAVHLAAALFAVGILGASSAGATTFTFDFTSPGTPTSAPSYSFNDGTLFLTVTPGTFVESPFAITTPSGEVSQSGAGLGVISPADGEPLIDAKDLNDIAIFSFNKTVRLDSILFNNTDPNDSFRYFYDPSGLPDNTLVDNGTFNPQNHPSGMVAMNSLFSLVSRTGDLFGFGALLDAACNNCKNNEWRIGALTVSYATDGDLPPEVPIPAALPLLLGGLGGLTWMARRQKRNGPMAT